MTTKTWGARDLSVRFGSVEALDGVDVEVEAGAITCVIGGDGAGKTTLLRTLAGAVRPSSGTVRRPERSRIGYVAGASGVYGDLSVAENIAFVGEAYGIRGEVLSQRTKALLAQTGLEHTQARLADHLSGGMRQKLAFALAMLHEPDLLILDEPTTGVDPISRVELWRMITGAAAAGAGVLVTTTHLDEAERASRVVVLKAGRVASPSDELGPTALRPPPQRQPHTAAGRRDEEPPLATARSAVRRFGHLTAVGGVDLTVRPGEVVGLIGPNGSGKTTLIRLLLGLLAPTAGAVELFGQPPSRATRKRLGYLPQGLGLWRDLTVAENLAFWADAFGCERPELEPDLAASASTLVRDLPLGLCRRLAFTAILAHRPELLVLDEPTSGVDPQAREGLWRTIHRTADGGVGVLVTTHFMSEAELCDRIVFLADGHVLASGSTAELIGSKTAVVVEADHWERAFAALEALGLSVAACDRTLRIAGAEEHAVSAALAAQGIAARLSTAPATFEEAFVLLAASGERAAAAGEVRHH